MNIPKRLCKNGTLWVCSACGKVKKHNQWIEFTEELKKEAEKQVCHIGYDICPTCGDYTGLGCA